MPLNPAGVTTVGARPTLASSAIGEVCAQTLFKEGRAAAAAVAAGTVNESLEAVVEANTLLSGLGFESDEAAGVAEFFATVGLPIHLGQLSLDAGDTGALDVVVEGTLAFPFLGNMPQPMTAPLVRSAVLDAHRLGLSVAGKIGDAAYRRVQGG